MVMKIPMEEAKEFNPIEVPNDFYKAKIADIRSAEGKFGLFMAITFEITDGEHKGKQLDGICNYKLNKRTKLYAWLIKLGMSPKVGEEFDTDTMLGKECRILTQTGERESPDGTKYKQSNVKDVEALQ